MDAQDVWLMNNAKYAKLASIYIYLSAHNALRFMKIVLNACMILLVHSQSVQFVVLDFTSMQNKINAPNVQKHLLVVKSVIIMGLNVHIAIR